MNVTIFEVDMAEVDMEPSAESIYFFKGGNADRVQVRIFIDRKRMEELRDQITAALKEQHEPATETT